MAFFSDFIYKIRIKSKIYNLVSLIFEGFNLIFLGRVAITPQKAVVLTSNTAAFAVWLRSHTVARQVRGVERKGRGEERGQERKRDERKRRRRETKEGEE